MTRSKILQAILTIMKERLDLNVEGIDESSTQSDLGVDSIIMVDLMLDVEEALDFRFDSMELPRNPTLGDIVSLIQSNLEP